MLREHGLGETQDMPTWKVRTSNTCNHLQLDRVCEAGARLGGSHASGGSVMFVLYALNVCTHAAVALIITSL